MINSEIKNVILNDFNTWAGKNGQMSGEGLLIDSKDHGSLYIKVFENDVVAAEFLKFVGKNVDVILSNRKAGNAYFINGIGISLAGK